MVLITKLRPEWQKGLINGIGGKIEGEETTLKAMIREFQEEAGAIVDTWERFAVVEHHSRQSVVHFFKAFGDLKQLIYGQTDEMINIYDVDQLPINVVPNLRWLVPLALDRERINVPRFELSVP